MSAKGNCYGNESWNHSLKVESIHGERFATRKQERVQVFESIGLDYNRKRMRSTLGYLSSRHFELANAAQTSARILGARTNNGLHTAQLDHQLHLGHR